MNLGNTSLAKRIGAAAAAFLLGSLIGAESTSIDLRPKTPYRDITNVLTVCDGITGADVIPGKTYTDEECDALLAKHADRHAVDQLSCVRRRLDVYEVVAWTHFAYNVGTARFCRSTAVQRINRGERACDEIGRWMSAGGKDCRLAASGCPGIPARRARERAICEMRIRIPGLFDGVVAGVSP